MDQIPHEEQAVGRILAQHFVAGFQVQAGHVYRCAPIIRYMNGWRYESLESYCKSRGWAVELEGGESRAEA